MKKQMDFEIEVENLLIRSSFEREKQVVALELTQVSFEDWYSPPSSDKA